jgi:hypothetical protein
MQGVTFRWADDNGSTIDPTFTIRTPDVPVGENLEWSVIAARCWINVGARGVHADIFSERGSTKPDDPLEMLVGPNYSPSYVPPSGDGEPFSVTLETVEFDRRYTWLFQFVESAVHRSDMNGKVHLGFPTSDDLPFEHMQFTSTAHNTGAEVKLFEPIQLGYWDLDLVPKQLSSTVGAMSVRTGQIFITAAGIHEPRHFARPFNLLWGELLASGEAGGFLFDHDTSGQEFDGFVFVPEVVALSEVATEPGAAPPYLHVAGTAQFDFFGANYLDIRDHRDDANPGAPHNGRTIVLAEGGEHDAKPTDFHVARAWDGDFGALDFTIQYDDQDQDGFVSDPQAVDSNRFEVAYFDNVPVAAALDLKSERACISIREEEERTVSFPLLIDLGKVKRITGCGCIEDGVLKRFILASELSANGSGLALRSGAYVAVEKIFTPATSEFSLNGDLFLNVLGGGDVQVNGQVHFLLDREKDFFEGDIKGKIDASSYLGFIELGGLSAEGQLSWHVGSFDNDGYQLLQGKVAVNVVAPAGAAGAGVEGGFLLGMNAPREKAWVIIGTDHRFDGNIQLLPPVLTGVFGYAKVSSSVNAYVVSGGFDAYLGAGGFLGANGLPGVFGHMYANIWGEFLGGLLSASAWLDAQIYLEVPNLAEPLKSIPKFQGSVGVQVCAVWVLCATEEVTMTIDGDGFEFTN